MEITSKGLFMSLDRSLLFFLMLISLLYITPVFIPVPIYYILFAMLTFAYLTLKKVVFEAKLLIVVLLFFCSLIFQFINSEQKLLQTCFYFFASVVTYFLINNLKVTNRDDLILILNKVCWFFSIIVIIDTVFRFAFPSNVVDYTMVSEDLAFYKYKISYFFLDSNVVALLLLHLLCLRLLVNWYSKGKIFSALNLLLFLLIVLTLSRSAIVTAFLFFFLLLIPKTKLAYFFITLVLIFTLVIGSFFIIDVLSSDSSGSTKLNELISTLQFVTNYPLSDIMWGYGIGHGDDITGRYIHGLLPKLLIELGLVPTVLYFLLIFMLCSKNSLSFFYFLSVIISGLSFSFYVLAPYQLSAIAFLNIYKNSIYERS